MRWLSLFEGIRARLLVISILPVVIAAAALSWFSLFTLNDSLGRAFFQTGESAATFIAATAELGMYAEDQATLRRLGNNALKTPAVVSIGFINRDNRLLTVTGDRSVLSQEVRNGCIENGSWESGLYWFICKAVLENDQSISDFESEDDIDDKLSLAQYGWVALAVSREAMLQQQQANIQFMIAVAVVAVLAAALLAIVIARSISVPVLSLKKTVGKMDAGDFSSRAREAGPLEIRILARGINQLAASVGQTQEQLAGKINDATRRLVTTMDVLKSKNRDLEKAQQDLQLAMTAKDQFLARMSHELRTPLTAVSGFSRLLGQSKLSEEQAGYSDTIAAASELLLDTVDDILSFSKLQAGAVSIECIAFNLREVMERLVAMHGYQADRKSLDLALLIDPLIPKSLLGDPTRIKQIVNNLLDNAVKFTNEGKVVLHITLLGRSDREAEVLFEVSDSGIGIDEDNQERLFQPFTQADDTITRRFGGTGLGLVICKQLAELMGGSIDISSRLGEGTCMAVRLPLTIDESVMTVLPDHLGLSSNAPGVLTGLAVLLAEDNDFNRKLIKTIVERLGATVVAVPNGAEAVAVFQQQVFDVVLMDVHMPVMDGISATTGIVALAGDTGIAVIGLTAHVSESEYKALMAAGAVAILDKPLNDVALVKMICEATGQTYNDKALLESAGSETLVDQQSLRAEFHRLFEKVSDEVSRRHYDRAGDALHMMLGLSGVFGKSSLSQLIRELSSVLRTGENQHVPSLLAELKRGIDES